MTEEEKKAAEAKALADAEAAKLIEEQVMLDPLKQKDEEIAKLTQERDNYKAVALKRKGKLAEDDEFFAKEGLDEIIKDKVAEALAEKEISRAQAEKEAQLKQIIKENSELKLALKNKPGNSVGGGSGATVEVKDNVFSAEQLVELKKKAIRLKVDPDKFIESAKKNFFNNNR